jgi:hypothetical protein
LTGLGVRTVTLGRAEARYAEAAVEDAVTLFRPTGPGELELVRQSGWKRWPPRLDWQPIFYPVLNEEYAVQIARDWNAKDPATGHRGYVTRFKVRTSVLDRYEVHRVGGRVHDEYWIPAAEVEGLNDNIVGEIEVISIFTGAPPGIVARSYQGPKVCCDFEDDMGSISLACRPHGTRESRPSVTSNARPVRSV